VTEIDDELLESLTNSSVPVDRTPESIMRWFLNNYGTYNGAVVKLATGKTLSKVLARDEWGAKYTFQVEREGRPDLTVNPIDQLFREMDRVEIQRFGMWPKQPYGYIGNGCFNYFTGWLTKPVKGDISIWFNFVDQVLVDIPGAADFFHDWVAHMVQKPWLKHHTFIVLAGKQGSGKSLLGKSIADMLGTDSTDVLDQRSAPAMSTHGDSFLGHFNKQMQGKGYIVVDELGTDKRKSADTMKHYVTSATFEITAKYHDTVSQENYCNFLITTNESTALLVDEDSRRDVIFNIQQNDKDLMQKLGGELVKWQEAGGLGAMLEWYLNRDVSSFNNFARAPRFVGFENNVFQSKTDNAIMCDAFCEALRSFGKVVALSPTHISFIVESLGYTVKGQQFSRVLSARPEFIESKLIKSKGLSARFSVLGPRGVYSPQEALKNGIAFYELYRSVGNNVSEF